MADDGWLRVEGAGADGPFPASARLGDHDIVVFSTPQGLCATDRGCPHQFADMARATLAGDGKLVRCPMHAFTFRLVDGKGVNCPGFRIGVYDIVEREGALHARARNRAGP